MAWGIRAVISTSFADIFRSNALKNGLLPIVVETATCTGRCSSWSRRSRRAALTVDLDAQVVHLPGDEDIPFDVDPFAKQMLLAGTDELGWLLAREPAIAAYEARPPGPGRHARRRLSRGRHRSGSGRPAGTGTRVAAVPAA